MDTVEERFVRTLNQNAMVGEDIRSQAAINLAALLKTRLILKEKVDVIESIQTVIDAKQRDIDGLNVVINHHEMEGEDHLCQIRYKSENIIELNK